jgi:hypothetical protein
MSDAERILKVEIYDDLHPELLAKAVEFFKSNFPSDATKPIDLNFFTSKLGAANPFGRGYFSVATHHGKVVGTCTAVRKRIVVENEIVDIVEIGDTFTSPNYRKNCYFDDLYHGTKSKNEYLNKSIFGRLATETLDRARLGGSRYVFGTPNLQAKLSWLKRMEFKLVDQHEIFRVSAATKLYPLYNRNKLFIFISRVYLSISYFICLLRVRKYRLSFVKNMSEVTFDFESKYFQLKNSISIENDPLYLENRYCSNLDKAYEVVKISAKKTGKSCGYLFFYRNTRVDGFTLLMLSKSLFADEEMFKLKLPFSRLACKNLPDYHNLSVWLDRKIMNPRSAFLYGFASKKLEVDIVGRQLDTSDLNLEKYGFSNFDYGDSDLG